MLKTSDKTSRVAAVSLEESETLKELKALRVEVNEIKKKQGSGTESTERSNPLPKRKNDNCKGKSGKCSHCWSCGGYRTFPI